MNLLQLWRNLIAFAALFGTVNLRHMPDDGGSISSEVGVFSKLKITPRSSDYGENPNSGDSLELVNNSYNKYKDFSDINSNVNNIYVPTTDSNVSDSSLNDDVAKSQSKLDHIDQVDEPDNVVRLAGRNPETLTQTSIFTSGITSTDGFPVHTEQQLQESSNTENYENEVDSEPFEDSLANDIPTSETDIKVDSIDYNNIENSVTYVTDYLDDVPIVTSDIIDYDLVSDVYSTLTKTVTVTEIVYYDPNLKSIYSRHRVQRTIPNPQDEYDQYKEFDNDVVTLSASTFVSVQTKMPDLESLNNFNINDIPINDNSVIQSSINENTFVTDVDMNNSQSTSDSVDESYDLARVTESSLDVTTHESVKKDDDQEVQESLPVTIAELESELSITETPDSETDKNDEIIDYNSIENSVTYVKDYFDNVATLSSNVIDYDLESVVYSTLVKTVTVTDIVYYDSVLQSAYSRKRVQRTISQPADEYRGFGNDVVTPTLSTFMSFQTKPAFPDDIKKSRRSDADPDIDDIIQGIMKILGGNVKLDAASSTNTKLTTYNGNVYSSRINNRGPPRNPIVPFGSLPPSPQYSGLPVIPLRPPISPPSGNPVLIPPGRPPYVANTRPPFLAPLPPSLASRPPTGNKNIFLTRQPLPIGSLTDYEIDSDYDTSLSTPSSAFDITTNSYINELDSSMSSSLSTSQNIVSTTEITDNNIIVYTDSTNDLKQNITKQVGFPTRLTNNLATLKVSTSSIKSNLIQSTPDYDLATSLVAPGFPSVTVDILPTITELSSTNLITTSPSSSQIQSTSIISSTVLSSTENQKLSDSTESPTLPSTSLIPPQSTPPLPTTTSKIPPLPITTPQSDTTPSDITPASPDYQPRPGVVVDDPIYRPGQVITGAAIPYRDKPGDIFDVTVSAYQGFGSPPASPPNYQQSPQAYPYGGQTSHGQPYVVPVDVLTEQVLSKPSGGVRDQEGYVSIDGRKTYFNLFPTATQAFPSYNTIRQPQPQPGRPYNPTAGTGVGVIIPEEQLPGPALSRPSSQIPPKRIPKPPVKPPPRQRPPTRRPSPPPRVRIDTCIVGDLSTCHEELGEVCKTVEDVSSCYCNPGTFRKRHRTPCKKTVTLHMSMKVDRVGDQRIVWGGNYGNPESEEYKVLEWEAKHAIDNAMSKTPLSSMYLGSSIQKFYSLGGKVIVNSTVTLEDNPATHSSSVKAKLQRHMIQVIQKHGNNIGDSALGVEGPLNPIPQVSDINECKDKSLHNCHEYATCINQFGSFTCQCLPGYTDRHQDDPLKVGRDCETCSNNHCNKRGDCYIDNGQRLCRCKGSYYGAQCEIDGEVLGVAVGASVAAVVIIILTLIFLCLWSRKWKAQDRKSAIMVRGMMPPQNNVYNMTMPHKATLPYCAMEDRIRWASMAEAALANQNIYSQQPEHLRPPMMHDHMSQHSNYHTMASRDYASLGTIPTMNHFSMNHLNASQAPSTYGGVSQAPTLGARTPQPLRDARGSATMGPLGGASVIASGYGPATESSEEDLDRPYQLPRPKSRTSLGDMDDIYNEPADFELPPMPSRDPPPLPKSFVPQTFNMASFNR